ncbi:hypothetical protein [Azospirillum largimobile]
MIPGRLFEINLEIHFSSSGILFDYFGHCIEVHFALCGFYFERERNILWH